MNLLICNVLHMSPQTICNRVSDLMYDSGLHNRTELSAPFVHSRPGVMGKAVI